MSNRLTDVLIATGKGAVSLFPGGGFLAEYISLAQNYVADKRMNEWKARVDVKCYNKVVTEVANKIY